MRILSAVLLFSLFLQADDSGRVFLISLDGFGFQAFTQDPAAAGMRNMKRLADEGIVAPMQAAFPSLTAAGHASLFTGVYGDKNGITANEVSRRPRSSFHFDDRVTGFRAEQLDAEHFWLKLGRGGLRVVAHNPPQGFPCNAYNSGQNVAVMNGYQTPEVAPATLLKGANVTWLPSAPLGYAAPERSRKPVLYFEYTAARVRFVGAILAKGARYDTIRLTAYAGGRYVEAAWKEAEDLPLGLSKKPRPLARFFSEALPVASLTAVHFRLFDLSEDGRDFLLYQTAGKELSLCVNGQQQEERVRKNLLTAGGAFVGNGAGSFYERGDFGPIQQDGKAERRFMETLELHARQTMRHTRALLAEYDPQLLVDYMSTVDDMSHLWWAWLAQSDKFILPFREWGYQIADWRIGELKGLLRAKDHLIIVSDHGMTSMSKELRLNLLLKEWGYRDRVFANYYGLFVNTVDWKDGRVSLRNVRPLLEEIRAKLAAYRSGGETVFSTFF